MNLPIFPLNNSPPSGFWPTYTTDEEKSIVLSKSGQRRYGVNGLKFLK